MKNAFNTAYEIIATLSGCYASYANVAGNNKNQLPCSSGHEVPSPLEVPHEEDSLAFVVAVSAPSALLLDRVDVPASY